MPSKKNEKENEKNAKSKVKTVTCGMRTPGPKYKLKTLVGYSEHCTSKYRNPAYTIGKLQKIKPPCIGPGPKYLYNLPGSPGFTIPRSVHMKIKDCSPGPIYMLPGFKSPAFTIVGKPKEKCPPTTPGPFDPPKLPPGPAFTIGSRGKEKKCEFSPPLRGIGDSMLTKSPAFSIIGRPKVKDTCIGPGPKYFPNLMKKSPAYTFGMKHSECVIPAKTECDELC